MSIVEKNTFMQFYFIKHKAVWKIAPWCSWNNNNSITKKNHWIQQCWWWSDLFSVALCAITKALVLSASFIQSMICFCKSSFRAPDGSWGNNGTSIFKADVYRSKAATWFCSYEYNSAWRPISKACCTWGVDANSESEINHSFKSFVSK